MSEKPKTYKIKRKKPKETPVPAPRKPKVKPVPKPRPRSTMKDAKVGMGFKAGDKVKFKRKLKEIKAPELKKFTGLTKTEANKLDPLKLFGKLPAELRKTILQPKTTGVVVGKKDLLNDRAIYLLGEVLDLIGFIRFTSSSTYGWSYYEEGNFNQSINKYFEKQAKRIDDAGGVFDPQEDLLKLLKNDKFRRACFNSHKEMNYAGEYIFEVMDLEQIEQRIYMNGEDREDYYPSDTYGFIYEDGEYYTSNRTRSTTRATTSERVKIIRRAITTDFKPFLELVKGGNAYK